MMFGLGQDDDTSDSGAWNDTLSALDPSVGPNAGSGYSSTVTGEVYDPNSQAFCQSAGGTWANGQCNSSQSPLAPPSSGGAATAPAAANSNGSGILLVAGLVVFALVWAFKQ